MSQKEFSADVAQLINLVTHSIYSNKDIFLRELLSNASDAIAKAQFTARTNSKYLGDDHDLRILIEVDKKNQTITLTDNGIGMTEAEVIEHIWTIAKSGTKAFVEAMEKNKDWSNDLIGQFGIWFYSVFMVASKVELETKSNADDKATLRTSEGKGSYEIKKSDKKTRGTTIRIFLSDENKEYADDFRVKWLIRKHSNYVPFPILMEIEEKKDEEKKDSDSDAITIGDKSYSQINKTQSIWSKKKNDVTDEEYKEFYSSLTFDQADPLDIIHLEVEWAINYKALLYIPQKHNPMAAMMGNQEEFGPSLYVQNVLIMENAKDLLPWWLRFVKGVVETPDLPLNVSREILQNNALMSKIQKSLTKKVLESLRYQMKENSDAYEEFFSVYGKTLKEWIHFDRDNKEAIAWICKWHTLNNEETITLDQYCENKKSDRIYYLTGANLKQIKTSPYLEKFKDTDYDVLLMPDPIDDWVVQGLQKYKETELQDAKTADISSWENSKEKEAAQKKTDKINGDNKNFIAFAQQHIGKEFIESVKLVTNLSETAAVLIPKEWAPSAQQERYMKAMGNDVPTSVQDLQINADHPIVTKMIEVYNKDPKDASLPNYLSYLHQQALLLQGREIENISDFIKSINSLIQ